MEKECIKCKGEGQVEFFLEALMDWFDGAPGCPQETCPRCNGTGKEPDPNSFEARTWY